MASDLDRVTVVIPYGGGNDGWLEEAVHSVGRGPKVVVARNDNDLAGALNRALEEADTEFVFRLDADDILFPGSLDMMLGPAWNADVVYPAVAMMNERQVLFAKADADPFCPYRMQHENFVVSCSLMRREKVLEVGGWREMPALEDWDLWVRMYHAGARFKPCKEAAVYIRFHDGSRNTLARQSPEFRQKLRRQILGEQDPLSEVKATFYSQDTPATAYLRCQLPARYLPGLVNPHVEAMVNGEDVAFPNQVGPAAVFQFPGDKARAALASVMRAEGIRTLVEVDDNYLIDPGKDVLKRAQWDMEIGKSSPHSRQGHRWIVGHVDGVIVTNTMLRDYYAKVNPNVFICPNTVDPRDWPEPQKADDGIFRIGWAASKSHDVDIPLVTKAFEWASRQPNVEVYVAGLDPGWSFRYGHIPWLDDLDAYRTIFQTFDVSIAPIIGHPFAVYRSDVKALESAMGLAAPVLSDVPPYAEWDDTRCLKFSDAKGLLKIVQYLVSQPERARELAKAALDYTLAERTTQMQIHSWEAALEG